AFVIDIAQGDDIGPEFSKGGDVAAAHASGPDARQVDPLTRRDEARSPQDVARDKGGQGGSGSGGKERSARTLRHGCYSIRVVLVPRSETTSVEPRACAGQRLAAQRLSRELLNPLTNCAHQGFATVSSDRVVISKKP